MFFFPILTVSCSRNTIDHRQTSHSITSENKRNCGYLTKKSLYLTKFVDTNVFSSHAFSALAVSERTIPHKPWYCFVLPWDVRVAEQKILVYRDSERIIVFLFVSCRSYKQSCVKLNLQMFIRKEKLSNRKTSQHTIN